MKKRNKIIIFLVLVLCFTGISVNLTLDIYAEDNGTVIEIPKSEFDEGYSDAKVIQKYLNLARDNATDDNAYRIVVPEGTYEITSGMSIYSNTHLCLNGVILKRCSESIGMFRSGNNSDINNGYDGYKNITIEGGILDANGNVKEYADNSGTLIRIAHAKNILLDRVTLQNGNNLHYVEVAGVDGFTMKDCNIYGRDSLSTVNTKNRSIEAVQLDVLHDESRMKNFGNYDDTPMKNVLITDCTFKDVQRGVGSHSMVVGIEFENIRITDNKFENISKTAIAVENYRNCDISNNVIINSGAGIDFKNMHSNEGLGVGDSKIYLPNDTKKTYTYHPNVNTTIRNNKITVKKTKYTDVPTAIRVYGELVDETTAKYAGIKAGDYYVENVIISDNEISDEAIGIKCGDTRNSVITNNKIRYTGKISASTNYSISLYDNSTNNVISGNEITGSGRHGIYTSAGCSKTAIKNNKITSVNGNGIRMFSCGDKNVISGNTLNISRTGGIVLDNTNATITNNKLSNDKGNGISVQNSSKATIKGNTITKASSRGISVSLGSGATIESNTIRSSGLYGIDIQDPKKKNSTIGENKITSSKKCAIHIASKPSVSLKSYHPIVMKKKSADKKGASLTFNKVNGVNKYCIYRKIGSGAWKRIATKSTTSYIDKNYKKGKKYQYKIVADVKVNKVTVKNISSNILTVR